MLSYAHIAGTKAYPVEVSGWDSQQSFFVENCDLLWHEENGKHITLARTLQNSSILFVRLLKPGPRERAHPVVYAAEFFGKAANGQNQFRLKALVPTVRDFSLF